MNGMARMNDSIVPYALGRAYAAALALKQNVNEDDSIDPLVNEIIAFKDDDSSVQYTLNELN